MLRFQYEEFFWILILVPVMILLWSGFRRFREMRFSRFFSTENLSRVWDISGMRRRSMLPWLTIIAVVLLVFGLANLQKGSYEYDTSTVSGRDILYALDVSKSMNAEDVQPSRMEVSKLLIQRLINKSKGDRIGLMVFAGDATVLSPPSTDYYTVLEELQRVRPGMAAVQGTSISDALRVAAHSFEKNTNKYKSLVLITDGEDHEKGIDAQLKKLKSEGVDIYTVGVGSAEGASFIDPTTGQAQVDRQGHEVTSQMNPELIQDIAASADGDYIYLRSVSQATSDLRGDLAMAGANVYKERNFQKSKSYYLFFVIIAFVLLIMEWLLPRLSRPSQPMVLLLFGMVFSTTSYAQTTPMSHDDVLREVYEANKLLKKKKYDKAEEKYNTALQHESNNQIALYNLATNNYLQQNAAQAREGYERAASLTDDPVQRARTYYNIGNTHMLEKNWDAAIESYKKSLLLNPADENARYNLAYAQKMKKKDENQQNQNQQNQDQNQDQNNDSQDNKDQQNKSQNSKNQQNQQQNQKKEQQKDKQNKGDEQQKSQQPKPEPKLSKEEAERALQGLRNKSRQKGQGDTAQGRPVRMREKDW